MPVLPWYLRETQKMHNTHGNLKRPKTVQNVAKTVKMLQFQALFEAPTDPVKISKEPKQWKYMLVTGRYLGTTVLCIRYISGTLNSHKK